MSKVVFAMTTEAIKVSVPSSRARHTRNKIKASAANLRDILGQLKGLLWTTNANFRALQCFERCDMYSYLTVSRVIDETFPLRN